MIIARLALLCLFLLGLVEYYDFKKEQKVDMQTVFKENCLDSGKTFVLNTKNSEYKCI